MVVGVEKVEKVGGWEEGKGRKQSGVGGGAGGGGWNGKAEWGGLTPDDPIPGYCYLVGCGVDTR